MVGPHTEGAEHCRLSIRYQASLLIITFFHMVYVFLSMSRACTHLRNLGQDKSILIGEKKKTLKLYVPVFQAQAGILIAQ